MILDKLNKQIIKLMKNSKIEGLSNAEQNELKEQLSIARQAKASLVKDSQSKEKKGNLTEEDEVNVIKKTIKDIREEINMFKKAKNSEKVKSLQIQLSYIMSYLPKPTNDETINFIIDNEAKKLNREISMKDMKHLISKVKEQVSPSTESKTISLLVKQYIILGGTK